jgi:hypothetical protein
MNCIMKRTIDPAKLTLLTIATISAITLGSSIQAFALSGAESGGATSSGLSGNGPAHTAVSRVNQASTSSAQTAMKPTKLRYGNLLRSKPADPSNFGLLKSYCNHSHRKRWSAK